MWNRLLTAYRILAALLILGLTIWALTFDFPADLRTGLLGMITLGVLVGAVVSRLMADRVGRRALGQAEAVWTAGGPPDQVLALLPRRIWITGELGHRIDLLRSLCHMARGQRELAWLAGLDAHLARLPWWARLTVAPFFRRVPEHPTDRRIAWGRQLIRLAPHLARLRHLQGILLLRKGTEASLELAWDQFAEALPLAGEDPMILEDLMLAGFHHGRDPLAERALRLLLDRHGDPRLPWDRGTPALRFLQAGRYAGALSLVQGLPPELRTLPMHWLAESVSLRQLGDRQGAWQCIGAALARLPDAFRLWMERYQVALELHQDLDARESLEGAWRTIPEGPEGESLRQEWRLRRAEFAFWWEDDPGSAWDQLVQLPAQLQAEHHPPLRLQVRVALGEYEAAYAEVLALLKDHPKDPDLLMLQADCMAGMAAWEALFPFLDGLGEACRERPLFWHLRGLALAHLEDHLAARQDLERAVRMDARHPRFLLDAGHACAELGEWERAESHWRQALQAEPDSEEALIHLAEARRELQDPEGSRRYLRECLLHHPESADAQARLAELEAN